MNNVKNLVDLADTIVPINFQTDAPQFYELIKTFLRTTQTAQEMINSNFLNSVDFDSIEITDWKEVYINTYLGMFGFTDIDDSIDSLGELANMAKDISSIKGTAFLYTILLKLLYFIDPTISTQYNEKLTEYNEETDPTLKATLKAELDSLKEAGLDQGNIIYNEYYDDDGVVIPFTYGITTDISEDTFTNYLYQFAHPSGWICDYTNGISLLESESLEATENIVIYTKIPFPDFTMDGEQGTEYYNSELIVDDPVLGDLVDLETITSKISETDRIYTDDDYVYYRLDHFDGITTEGSETGDIDVTYTTPLDSQIRLRYGGFSANTYELSTCNGGFSLDGSSNLTYQIKVIDGEDEIG